MPTIGVLLPTSNDAHNFAALRDGLRAAGWPEPRLSFDIRTAATGTAAEIERLAQDLAAAAPALLVTASSPAAVAVARAAPRIPLVFINVFDPVSLGLATSMASPGGNATGIAGFPVDVAASWVRVLHRLAPDATRIGLLFHPGTAAAMATHHIRAGQEAAEALGLAFRPRPIDNLADLPGCLASPDGSRHAVIVAPSTFMMTHRHTLVATIARHRIPALYAVKPMIEAGGMAAWGPDITEQWRAAVHHVGAILSGRPPGGVPIIPAPRTGLTINRRSLEALGLTVPPDLLATAVHVAEGHP